jgi:hypothetical protein
MKKRKSKKKDPALLQEVVEFGSKADKSNKLETSHGMIHKKTN